MLKNPQHDSVKRGGWGSRAVYTMCKKTSDLVEDGFPIHEKDLETSFIRQRRADEEEQGRICFLAKAAKPG